MIRRHGFVKHCRVVSRARQIRSVPIGTRKTDLKAAELDFCTYADSPVPLIYGDRVSDAESAQLIDKLRSRGTSAALVAANTVSRGPSRDATAATSTQAREAILFELKAWAGLDDSAPNLAALRDRLSAPPRGLRII